MTQITHNPPANVRADLNTLSLALDQEIPAKANDNLLVATWNIRSFSSLTRRWTARSSDSPKRDLRGLRAIIEILSRFDVIAIQELKGDLRALRDTMRFLGDDWGFLMTDVTAGDGGNNERLAYLFDRRRVRPSGLAAEITVPEERLMLVRPNALTRQFARTPYAVSFDRDGCTFILVTLHIIYGNSPRARLGELAEIAEIFASWARRSHRWHHNLICLGDFNIDRVGSRLYEAFTSTGLTVPNELMNLPRTIFDDPNDPSDDNFYDQIAWFTNDRHAVIDLQLRTGGNFNFVPHVYRDTQLNPRAISYRVSDHLPLWVEFAI